MDKMGIARLHQHQAPTQTLALLSYLEKSPGLVLLKFALFDDILKEFSACNILHDHEDVSRS